MVCVDEDCEGHAECKKGKCECKKPWEGDNCDRKKVHVDVEVSVEYTFADDSLERCGQLISDLQEEIEAAEEDAATSFTTIVTGSSGGSGSSNDSIDIDVTVAVNLGDCRDRDVALGSIAAAIDGATVPSNPSHWSRD